MATWHRTSVGGTRRIRNLAEDNNLLRTGQELANVCRHG